MTWDDAITETWIAIARTSYKGIYPWLVETAPQHATVSQECFITLWNQAASERGRQYRGGRIYGIGEYDPGRHRITSITAFGHEIFPERPIEFVQLKLISFGAY